MKQLADLFRDSLPELIRELESARAAPGSEDRVIREIAHRLRGSGGTYGFPEVSTAAAALESATVQASAAEVDTRLRALIAVLRAVTNDGSVQSPPIPSTTGQTGDGSYRILVVDDDPTTRMLAAAALRAAGHAVSEASDYEEASTRLAAADNPFDLLLIDVMLGSGPDGDGVAVAERLAGMQSNTPSIVFLTGLTADDQLIRMRTAGAAGILHKPFDPGTLARSLRNVLEMPS